MKNTYIFKPARWSWLGIVHFLGRESWYSPREKEGAMGSCGIRQVNGMDWTSTMQARGSLRNSRRSRKGSPIKTHVPYFWIMLELFEQDAKPSILKWLQTYGYTVIFFKTLAILPPLLLLSNFDVPDTKSCPLNDGAPLYTAYVWAGTTEKSMCTALKVGLT